MDNNLQLQFINIYILEEHIREQLQKYNRDIPCPAEHTLGFTKLTMVAGSQQVQTRISLFLRKV